MPSKRNTWPRVDPALKGEIGHIAVQTVDQI